MGDAAASGQMRKRRSRTSNSPEGSGDDGKKRGRPRVEKQDESAADRRRTQIRMAQRAYRQRKESTLDELRKRVSELTNTLELMNKAFVDCCDRLTTSGLSEAQIQDIQETSAHYETLMKCARTGEEPDPSSIPNLQRTTSNKDTEPKNVPSWIDKNVLNHEPNARPSYQVGMGYTMFVQQEDGQPNLDYYNNLDQTSQALVQQRSPHPNSLDAFRVEMNDSIALPTSISPPMTYSFQESTFGRRLHRASLEQGYQLLLDPQRRPHTYERVFRLSLLIRDRSKLVAAIKAMLERGPHEKLDSNAPLIHVGGAGTHYPRKDPFGNVQPKIQSWNLGIVGPHTLALLENAARDNLTTDMTVDIAGFEGEWFDPYDVEGYLNEKGIFIDPSTSFAEAEVVVWSPIASSSSISTGSTATAASPVPKPFNEEQIQDLNRNFNPEGGWGEYDFDLMNIMNMSDIGFSDAGTGSWMNFLQPGQSVRYHEAPAAEAMEWEGSKTTEMLQEVEQQKERLGMFESKVAGAGQQQKRVIIIDVAKFIKGRRMSSNATRVKLTGYAVMTVSSVCIGRTPGYKRRDVDRALALASFDAF